MSRTRSVDNVPLLWIRTRTPNRKVLAGVTQVSVSLLVIILELTGSTGHLLPIMVSILCAKMVTNYFATPSVYTSVIHMNRYPFLDVHMDVRTEDGLSGRHEFYARDIMRCDLKVVESTGFTLKELRGLVESFPFAGFPVVDSTSGRKRVGYLSRTELMVRLAQDK